MQPISLTNQSCIESREYPSSLPEEQLLLIGDENDTQTSTTIPMTPSSTLFHIRKQHIPLHTICNRLDEQTSLTSPPITTIDEDDQESSDDDKMLVP